VEAAVLTGTITETEKGRYLRRAEANAEEAAKQAEEAARQGTLAAKLAEARRIGAELGEDRAMDYVDSLLGKIPTADVNALRTIVSADHARESAKQKEAKEVKDNETVNEVVDRLQSLAPDTAEYINANVEDGKERNTWLDRFKVASERRARGEAIVTNERERGRLLDMAASIAWPERQVKIADVLRQANKARYDDEIIDDAAYNEVRDAIRKAKEDKSPFTEAHIERAIGELITGAPSGIMGMPLPVLRTRDDHIKYATNQFGRFVNRIPGVIDVINAKFPPPPESRQVEAAPDNPAFDFDGEPIGYYNSDGSITLNQVGATRLWELAGRDAKKAREMAELHRYIVPPREDK
jgi:hypothetical protein